MYKDRDRPYYNSVKKLINGPKEIRTPDHLGVSEVSYP